MARVAFFLVVFSLLLLRINSQKGSMEKLKFVLRNELKAHQEKYVVSLQGLNPARLLCPENSYQRYMTFSSEHYNSINETSGRFSQLNSIVIAYLSDRLDSYNTEKTFQYFCLRHSTIFVFLIDCFYVSNDCTSPVISEYLFNSPALKIVVPRNIKTNTRALVGAIATAGYFQYRAVRMSHIINKGLLASSIRFHKAHFWNGNLIKISADVDQSLLYLKKYRRDAYMCSEMIMNHKFKNNYRCEFDLMTTIYFAQVHNLSIHIFGEGEVFSVKNGFYRNIEASGNYFNYDEMSPFKRQGLAISYQNSQKIIYCPDTKITTKSKFDYSVWTEPFSLDIWIFYIVSFILVPCAMFSNGIGSKLEIILSLLSWQGVSLKNGKFVIFLTFPAMFLSIYYCNEITSLMVVPSTPKPIENLKVLLEAGYKIIDRFGDTLDIVMSALKEDFRQINMTDKLNSSFHYVPNQKVATKLLADRKTKYSVIVEGNQESIELMYYSRVLNNRLGSGAVNCQAVTMAVKPASYFRIFYTANRHWLFQTLQRIKDAGLDAKWQEYYTWNRLMREMTKARHFLERGEGLIEISKFTPVFLMWVLVALLANAVLFGELYFNRILEKLN